MLSLLSLLKSGRSALGQTEVTPRGVLLDLLFICRTFDLAILTPPFRR